MLEDFKVDGKWAKGKRIKGIWIKTLSGSTWQNMLTRVKIETSKKPSYEGCVVSEDFKDFQSFTDWHTKQIGYGLGYELDKDLLGDGKEYSGKVCVLVPHKLNAFLKPVKKDKLLPAGVFKRQKGYRAIIGIDGKLVHLGQYCTIEDAEYAYKTAKVAQARILADEMLEHYKIDARVIYALQNPDIAKGKK